MSDKYEKLCDECLTEMFRRVGLEYPNKELTDQPEWYTIYSWTAEEEDDFRKWMHKRLKTAKLHLSARQRELEVNMFLLNWGWKTDFGDSE